MLKLTLLRLVVTDRVPATQNRIFGYTESAIKVAFQKGSASFLIFQKMKKKIKTP